MAETEGFEPSIHLSAYNALAKRRLQPLGHVSSRRANLLGGRFRLCKPPSGSQISQQVLSQVDNAAAGRQTSAVPFAKKFRRKRFQSNET